METLKLEQWPVYFTVFMLRYLIIAGIAFLIFYVWYKHRFLLRRIQQKFPTRKDYIREVSYSVITTAIFATIAILLASDWIGPYTKIYKHISDKGIPYFLLSIVLSIFIHDTYFYWTHRLMHHPKLFKVFHLVHHKSTNPSPWAAFSFHPLEAIVEAGVIFVIVFLIPIHIYALAIFLVFMTVYNVYGHLGYELYPAWVGKSTIAKYMNTSVNHNMHHKLFKQNYGLYFRFWDMLMGTTHEKYEETFAEITQRKAANKEREKQLQ
jgi:sterol desaturase/sphingolipid hydroxylase (fatty acid hydroxylase superfamily)